MLQFHSSSSSDHPQSQLQQPQQQSTQIANLRLRDEPPQINTTAPTTRSRKRKATPASVSQDQHQQQHQQQQAQQQQQVQQQAQPQQHQTQPPPPHILPPSHPLVQISSIPGFYPPPDYTTGGLPPGPIPVPDMQAQSTAPASAATRALSNSKRAEQNRKAQRAFRERRDQHVKALESRSQLLEAALASADEANRRWEECRALVEQLRIENAALRAELSHHRPGGTTGQAGTAVDASKSGQADGSGSKEVGDARDSVMKD